MYYCQTSAWSSIPSQYLPAALKEKPPGENCPSCALETERFEQQSCTPIKDEDGLLIGYEYMGLAYHLHDFVLYYGQGDAAQIGYVIDVQPTPPPGETFGYVTIQKVGRMVEINHLHLLPRRLLQDEVRQP